MNFTPLPTLGRLKQVLNYDPDTGVFTWKRTGRGGFTVGGEAGYVDPRGYRTIRVDRKLYAAQRLAFLYVNGRSPIGDVDHRDGNKSNNRIKNLREASRAENGWNARGRHGASGVKGVISHHGRWRAYTSANRRSIHIGIYDTKEAAAAAVRDARVKIHGEFARHA